MEQMLLKSYLTDEESSLNNNNWRLDGGGGGGADVSTDKSLSCQQLDFASVRDVRCVT